MCPHFNKNNKKCNSFNEAGWSNMTMVFGLDFMLESFCLAPKTKMSTSGEEVGFSNCGKYKMVHEGENEDEDEYDD